MKGIVASLADGAMFAIHPIQLIWFVLFGATAVYTWRRAYKMKSQLAFVTMAVLAAIFSLLSYCCLINAMPPLR
jgi:hypothetical protein